MTKTIYLLVGASGSGKSTLGEELKQLGVPEIQSHTTRKPRPGEVPAELGGTYFFVTPNQFFNIEMVEETEYAQNYYGTSKVVIEYVLAQHDKCFAIVDAHGVKAFKQIYGDTVKVIYIHAPFSTLIERMKARGDSPQLVASRVKHALGTNEQDSINIADYCIINLDLGEAKRQLRCVVGVE